MRELVGVLHPMREFTSVGIAQQSAEVLLLASPRARENTIEAILNAAPDELRARDRGRAELLLSVRGNHFRHARLGAVSPAFQQNAAPGYLQFFAKEDDGR